MTSDRRGVLVTLEPEYLEYAAADGKALHAKHAGRQKFGTRTEASRIASSGAFRAVEQLHRIAPGDLRKHGLDCASTRNPSLDYVHIRPEHRGRVFFGCGPLEGVEMMLAGEATFLIYGSITEDRAKARPMDMTLDPPAHVWRVAELDDPPAPQQQAGPRPRDPDPEQLQLLDRRAGRVQDREVGA